jgi:hypothetical protein
VNYAERAQAPSFPIRIFWWTVFGAAFGCIEAAVVVYLRRLTGMAPGLDYRSIFTTWGAPFDSAGITGTIRRHGIFSLELTREVATLLLLASAAWASGRNRREKWGLFGYTFAVWDLTYYLYLALWIGFPHSLTATDIYFLVPIAWYGPVWFPVLIVMPALLVFSVRLLSRSQRSLS